MKNGRKPLVTTAVIVAMVLSGVCLAYAQSSAVLQGTSGTSGTRGESENSIFGNVEEFNGSEIAQVESERDHSDDGCPIEMGVLQNALGLADNTGNEGEAGLPVDTGTDLEQLGCQPSGPADNRTSASDHEPGQEDSGFSSPTEGEGPSEGDPPIVEEPGNEELPQDPPSVEEPVPEDVTTPGDDLTPSEPVQPDIIEPPTEPPVEPVKVSLTVEHILEWEGGQEALNTQVFEDISVGTQVYGKDYAISDETVAFLRSEPETLILVEQEDQNVLMLFYSIVDINPYIPEAPDFPPGEEIEIESPPVQVFEPGSLGPFASEGFGVLRKSMGMPSPMAYDDEVGNKTWPEPGSLNLAKTGEAVPDTGNQWELTLTIEGKNYTKTSDVVLLIDRSGSMNDTIPGTWHNKMYYAKIAASAFVNNLLNDPNDTSVRIAVVSFASDVTINSGFLGYGERTQLTNAINGLEAEGGTFIQLGIKQAAALLDGSTAAHKTIVLLGDGAATYSYEITNYKNYCEYWRDYTSSWITYKDHRTHSNVPQSEFSYSSTVGNGSAENYLFETDWWNGVRYYYRNGASAVAEAGFAKAKGYATYSIALSAGTEGEWTLKNIASGTEYYYPTYNPTDLTSIYEDIAGRIKYAARDAVVTDPIGDMYYIPGVTAANVSSFVQVSHGTVSYDPATRKIVWSIGQIVEGTTYWMKYKVTMKDEAVPGTLYPTNGPTSIGYTNIDDQPAKKYFPIPEYAIRGVTFTKVLDDPNYADKEFSIELEGPAGSCSKKWHLSLKPGETNAKTVKGLLPGTYTVREIVPMNFKLVGMTGGGISGPDSTGAYQLVINPGDWSLTVSIINERGNDGWFWDDDEEANTFHVAGGGGPSANAFLFATLQYFTAPESLSTKRGLGIPVRFFAGSSDDQKIYKVWV